MDRIYIDIIIINWNSGNSTLNAIKPYLRDSGSFVQCNIIVVDNYSSDNSIELLTKLPLTLIENKENLGFGQACNQALEYCVGKYILLLNPDTESHISVLEGLVAFLETQPQFAITGPQQLKTNHSIQKSCGRFPTFKTSFYEVVGISKMFPKIFTPAPIMLDWEHNSSAAVDHIMGSYMLISKKMIDIVGFMDDDYFVYWEDIDFSRRIYDAGFKSYYNSAFSIIHVGGESGDNVKFKRLFYSIFSRRIYWKKHLGKKQSIVLTFLSLTIEPILRIIECVVLLRLTGIKEILKAYKLYIGSLFQKPVK